MERIPERVREEVEKYFEEHKIPKDKQEKQKEILRELYRKSSYDPEPGGKNRGYRRVKNRNIRRAFAS